MVGPEDMFDEPDEPVVPDTPEETTMAYDATRKGAVTDGAVAVVGRGKYVKTSQAAENEEYTNSAVTAGTAIRRGRSCYAGARNS